MIRLTVVAAALVLLSGCSTTLEDLPLPGTDVAGDTVTIEADFDEALNLATGASVKVNGVDSGKVQTCLLYTSPSPRDGLLSRMPSSA